MYCSSIGSRASAKPRKKGDVTVGQVSPEAGPALKEAVEVNVVTIASYYFN